MKKGDKVRFLDAEAHETNPQYYPEAGTVGEVAVECDDGTAAVQWPKGSTSSDDRWLCDVDRLEIVEDGQAEEARDEQRP